MFFALSKILYFIIQPIVWLVGLLAWSFFTKKNEKKVKILRGVFWAVLLMTNPFLSNRVFHTWEYPATPINSMKDTFDVGIVLGGYSEFGVYPISDRLNFNEASNRFQDAYVLYKKGIIKKILITSGSGAFLGDKINEGDVSKIALLQYGVPETDILIENQSMNTHENAVFTKILLEKQGLAQSKLLLITSSLHMRRSIGCFKKVGLNFTPFPAHFFANRLQWDAESTILPDSRAFYRWEKFLKEWVGCIVYWLQGYI
jgi:uncharacterized SAM-binding protein YcdF (DUF218 family)